MSATSAASQARGILTFSSGFAAQIIEWDWDDITREFFDTSHQGLAAAGAGKFGNKTKIPSILVNPGTLKLKLNFNPDTLPPIAGSMETVTLKMGDGTTPAQYSGSGGMSKFKITGALEKQMEAEMEIIFSGNVTVAAAS